MRRSRRPWQQGLQSGEGRSGCIFWTLIALLFALFASEVAPVKMASMKLEDFMKELAMTQPRRPKEFFESEIFNKARSLDLEIPRKQIRVKKYHERVVMDVEFSAPVEVLGFAFDWDVKIHVDRDIFLM